jgi:hypothetical protein
MILGKRAVAEEMLRRRKAECKERGIKYNRREQIDFIAEDLRMDPDELANWLNRSKQAR